MDPLDCGSYVSIPASCIEISDDICLGSPSAKWEIARYSAFWALDVCPKHESYDCHDLVRCTKLTRLASSCGTSFLDRSFSQGNHCRCTFGPDNRWNLYCRADSVRNDHLLCNSPAHSNRFPT